MAIGFGFVAQQQVEAQFTPQYVALTNSVRDPFGVVLAGTDPTAPSRGIPYVPGALVQVLQYNGSNRPPAVTGQPDPQNPILYETHIGIGVSPKIENAGKFGAAITPRPSGQIFVRVFNKPSLGESSFYADSTVYTIGGNTTFFPTIPVTDKPLDPADDDHDGLNNSLEKALGSSSACVDTDGDGMRDDAELRAGTNPTDSNSFLAVAGISHTSNGTLRVTWRTVSGKSYRLLCSHDSPGCPSAYSNSTTPVCAGTALSSMELPLDDTAPTGIYCVQLVETP